MAQPAADRFAQQTLQILLQSGAIIENDHFVYDSGQHGSGWIAKVVDDVANTGLSVRQTVQAVRAAGGQVVGAGVLVTRGNCSAADLGVDQWRYLLEYRIP